MNKIIKTNNGINEYSKTNASKEIMGMCRAITPQFYKNKTIADMQAEKLSIELLIKDIDNETLVEMCKRAVSNYARERSVNGIAYFDINYILTFYVEAFNYIHCDSINLSKQAKKIWSKFDNTSNILYQKWIDNGEEIEIAVVLKDGESLYSPKDFENWISDLEDEEV